jgi:hypothetical protein
MIKLIDILKEIKWTSTSTDPSLTDKKPNPNITKKDLAPKPESRPQFPSLYQYTVGEKVRERYSDEEPCKILDRRLNWADVKENPIKDLYIPNFIQHNTEIDNKPWYLVKFLEHNKNTPPTWFSENELQPYNRFSKKR